MPFNFTDVQRVLIIFILLLWTKNGIAQSRLIQGNITSTDSEIPLVGVLVQDTLSGVTTYSNENGNFQITTSKSPTCLIFTYLGYKNKQVCENFTSTDPLIIRLTQLSTLNTVEVFATPNASPVNQISTGVTRMSIEVMHAMPQLVGEMDVIKSLSLLPGIALGVESTNRLFIRGSTPGQNLIMLDDMPIYNINHFGPFLTIFNPDAVASVDVWKAALPAAYGGRIGGMVKISQPGKAPKNWQGGFGISPLTGRAYIKSPLLNGTTNFLLTGRYSWLGILYGIGGDEENDQSYKMYDTNFKLTHRFSPVHQLTFSFFRGSDDFDYLETITGSRTDLGVRIKELRNYTESNWANTASSLRHQTGFGHSWSMTTIGYYTKYIYQYSENTTQSFDNEPSIFDSESTSSEIRDLGGKIFVNYHGNHLNIQLGSERIYQRIVPITSINRGENNIDIGQIDHGIQQRYFSEIELFPEQKFSALLGFVWTNFQTDSIHYRIPEPRINLRWKVFPTLAIRAGGNYGQQFTHLLLGGSNGATQETWMMSNKAIPPSTGYQLTTGLSWQSPDQEYEVGIDYFYKQATQVLDYRAIQEDELNNLSNWDDLLATDGEHQIQGLEVLVKKQKDKWQGWIAYTLSWNKQRFSTINRGDWFPFRFDRRHDVTLVGQYKFNDCWSGSFNWIYQSGIAISLPVASVPFSLQNNVGIDILEERNNTRLTAYHRLDLSCTYKWNKKSKKRYHSLTFGLYNTYNRVNPFRLEIDADPILNNNGDFMGFTQPKAKIIGLFPVLPALSYQIKFGKHAS